MVRRCGRKPVRPHQSPRRSGRSGRGWGIVSGLGLAILLLAGCGIPTGGPKAIARADVPFHLLDPATTTTTRPQGPPPVGVAETVYLVSPDQHLVPVARDVPVPANLTQIVGALLEGPTAAEQALGITTYVSGSRTQVSVSVAAGVATVDFAVDPVQVVGPDQTLAFAQVVYTVTQIAGVSGVVFHFSGQASSVPVASGAQVAGPVTRLDYLPQAPP
jgi:Sporulation and spore germination